MSKRTTTTARRGTMGEEASGTFGARLKRHRLAAGLTQERLAQRAGMSARAVSDLERDGARLPRLDNVGLLATALELTPEQHQALLAAARPQVDTPGSSLGRTHRARALAVRPAPLVGRARERGQLRECLATTLAGNGSLVLIAGEA